MEDLSDLTEKLVQLQAQTISHLQKQVENLKKENYILKNSLSLQTAEAEKSYRELESRFSRLSKPILNTIIHLVRISGKPCSYDQIIKAFKTRYSSISVKSETITRQVRKLREQGYLHSPEQGYFVPIPKKDEGKPFFKKKIKDFPVTTLDSEDYL